jgi:hypothetical protein
MVALRPGYREMIDPWWPAGSARRGRARRRGRVTWYGVLRRRIGGWALAIGGWAGSACSVSCSRPSLPVGRYLAALPALFGAAAAIVALSVRPVWAWALALGLGGRVAVLILAPPSFSSSRDGVGDRGSGRALRHHAGAGAAAVAGVVVSGPAATPARWRGALPGVVAARSRWCASRCGLGRRPLRQGTPGADPAVVRGWTRIRSGRWVSADTKPSTWRARVCAGREDLSTSFPLLGSDLGPVPRGRPRCHRRR